jgi:hypothetical protein
MNKQIRFEHIIWLAIGSIVMLAGCANRGNSNSSGRAASPERIVQYAMDEFEQCFKATPKGSKAKCATNFYSRINLGIDDSDSDKAPALRGVTKMYTLISKFDRGEITAVQDMQNGMRQISSELEMDLQRSRYYSQAQRASESQRQRQLFLDAQRLLAPVQSPMQTCSPANGAPPGTLICR